MTQNKICLLRHQRTYKLPIALFHGTFQDRLKCQIRSLMFAAIICKVIFRVLIPISNRAWILHRLTRILKLQRSPRQWKSSYRRFGKGQSLRSWISICKKIEIDKILYIINNIRLLMAIRRRMRRNCTRSSILILAMIKLLSLSSKSHSLADLIYQGVSNH